MSFLSVRTRRLKFWWHLSLAYANRYQRRVLISFIILILFILALVKLLPVINNGSTLTIGYVGNYTLEQIPTEVLTLATQSLITEGPDGKPQPSLASHWTVSEDQKTYTVFLKDNLTWHDATPVDAKDISIAITNVTASAINNKTIEFHLPNPISSFLEALDKPVFKTKTFYGTGEFRIVGIDQVDSMVKRIRLHPKNPNLPKVEIKFYPSEKQAITALKMGDIKILKVANAKAFKSWPNVDVKQDTDESSLVTVFFKTGDQLLSSRDLRQALTYAINKDNFDGESAFSPISSASWAYNPSVKRYDFSPAKAKEMLSRTNAKGQTITLSVMPGLDEVAKQIQDNWQAIGVNVKLKQEKGIPANFQALLAINHLPPDPDQYPLWHSTQKATNITGYVNVKIDKILEDARSTQDEGLRKDLYADFQRFLVEDDPAAFLYYPYTYQVVYKNSEKIYNQLPK